MDDAGIWFNAKRQMWEVRLGTSRKKRIWLGRYSTLQEARIAKQSYLRTKTVVRPWPVGISRRNQHETT